MKGKGIGYNHEEKTIETYYEEDGENKVISVDMKHFYDLIEKMVELEVIELN